MDTKLPAPPMTTQWLDKLDHVQQCYSRLAKLPLSIFGRGLSSSAYGISKLLYHAEFEGIPLDVVEQLSCLTTKLVDRGLAPESTALKLPGVPSALLPGSPKLGGFGILDVFLGNTTSPVAMQFGEYASSVALRGGSMTGPRPGSL
eukprot:gene24002-biopygen18501